MREAELKLRGAPHRQILPCHQVTPQDLKWSSWEWDSKETGLQAACVQGLLGQMWTCECESCDSVQVGGVRVRVRLGLGLGLVLGLGLGLGLGLCLSVKG